MVQTDLKEFLLKLNKNLQVLRVREAKYASTAPLDLLNQIDDYDHAIELTEQALEQDISLDDLQAEFSGLNLQIDAVVFVAQEPSRKPYTGRNPYRGLRKFTEDEAEFFFGRTAAIGELLETVKYLVDAETSREIPDLVAVLGPSGSGKSSLVQAGLVPALRQGRLPGSEQWPVKTMVPGPHPLTALAAQFVEPTGRGLPSLRADLDTGEQALHQLMLESLTLAEKPEEAVFVLVVDQFEELFTLCEDEAERQVFLAHLMHVAQVRHNRGFIILAMRADFYAKAAQYKNLAKTITLHQMLVSPMTERELREAILLPAEAVGLELEKALVESLLKDTAQAPGVLPLLQHTLLELFERRDGNLLTLAAYQEIGGVQGSLAHRADAIMDNLTPDQQQMARRIFMRLVQPVEGALDTRRRATFEEVLTQAGQLQAVESIVQTLADANLLITGRDPETEAVVLDVAHEALIQQWPQLRHWLDQDRQGFRIRQQLSRAARDWDSRDRDEDSLFRGNRLLEIEEWVVANPGEINLVEAAFLEASSALREQEQRREKEVGRNSLLLEIITKGAANRDLSEADLRGANLKEANLRGADLRRADLSGADLSGINLTGANLEEANLEGADLRKANLKSANLSKANLADAYLSGISLNRVNLEEADLRGADLEGVNLGEANLEEADLRGANLEGTILKQVNLRGANLERANLEEADLRGANLEGTILEQVNLRGANLEEANLIGNNLRGADLRGADLAEASLKGADLRRADLSGVDLREINLSGANLEEANLEGADLEEADLRGGDLSKADLRRANLAMAKIDDTTQIDDKWRLVHEIVTEEITAEYEMGDLRDAVELIWVCVREPGQAGIDLNGVDLSDTCLRGADLTGANLNEANLNKASLEDSLLLFANLVRADLSDADLTGAILTGAILNEANLVRADLSDAWLIGAILNETDLSGADLREANLEGVDLTRIKYDQTTKWPEEFNPENTKAGCLLIIYRLLTFIPKKAGTNSLLFRLVTSIAVKLENIMLRIDDEEKDNPLFIRLIEWTLDRLGID